MAFDRIIVGPYHGTINSTDVGALAEALLFYGKTHILLNSDSLISTIQTIGVDNFERMLDLPDVRVTYLRDTFATYTNDKSTHSLISFEFAGNRSRRFVDDRDLLQGILARSTSKAGRSRRITKRMVEKVEFLRLSEDFLPGFGILADCSAQLREPKLARLHVLSMLDHYAPSYVKQNNFTFDVRFLAGDNFVFDTDINFHEVNLEIINSHPNINLQITPPLISSSVLNACIDFYLAAKYEGAILTNELHSSIINNRYATIRRTFTKNLGFIEDFQRNISLQAVTLRETINSGAQEFSDFLDLLEKADEFKQWLHTIIDDDRLMKEYIDSISKLGWLEKLPAKTIRFSLFTRLGVIADLIFPSWIGTFSNIGVGAIDSFFVDKLHRGWKPQQFIMGPYTNFLNPNKGATYLP